MTLWLRYYVDITKGLKINRGYTSYNLKRVEEVIQIIRIDGTK